MAKFKKFKKGGKSSDYTTEDIVYERSFDIFGKQKPLIIPKGTYIGVGANTEDFKKLVYEGDTKGRMRLGRAVGGAGAAEINKPMDVENYYSAQGILARLREKNNWYKANENKVNYGYKDPKTFMMDTQPYFAEKFGTSDNIDEYKSENSKLASGRDIYSAEGAVSSQIGIIPYYTVPTSVKKIKPKKAKIKTEKTVRLKKATPYPDVYAVMSKPEAFGYKGGIQISSYIPNVGERKKVITREDYEKNVKPFYKRDTRATKSRYNVVRKEFKLP